MSPLVPVAARSRVPFRNVRTALFCAGMVGMVAAASAAGAPPIPTLARP